MDFRRPTKLYINRANMLYSILNNNNIYINKCPILTCQDMFAFATLIKLLCVQAFGCFLKLHDHILFLHRVHALFGAQEKWAVEDK